MNGEYDDIIHLPHHVSTVHRRMSRIDRAAQFAPFAALTGYDAAVKETARLTDVRGELDDSAKVLLNEKLQIIADGVQSGICAEIIYFKPDGKKEGGAYVTAAGAVRKIDTYKKVVVMADGTVVPIEEIFEIWL